MREIAGVGDELVTSREIARGAEVSVSRRALSGCHAQVNILGWCVYLNARGRRSTQNFSLAHELIHLILTLNDAEFPHDEEHVDWGAVALLMPPPAVRALLRRVGIEGHTALIAAWPEVPPAWVMVRCAWVARVPIAVHHRGSRLVWAPEDYPVPERGVLWEQRLVREVRGTGMMAKTLWGAVGMPLGEVGADGVLVIYSEGGAEGW